MVHRSVGYDAAKTRKGLKRHLVVGTLGLMMDVAITADPIPERAGGQQVFEKLHQLGKTAGRVYLVWIDGGYTGPNFLPWAMDTLG